jgi:hypothetical protein
MIRNRSGLCLGIVLCLVLVFFSISMAQEGIPTDTADGPVLSRAVMCESIEGYEPLFVAVAFSINTGKISCYTSFENIKTTTFTVHRWYRRNELVTTKRLTLKSPRWATYSSIQLREADKGPWRVEVWDADDKLVQTLRFSVTD